jgi:hypothetical protein
MIYLGRKNIPDFWESFHCPDGQCSRVGRIVLLHIVRVISIIVALFEISEAYFSRTAKSILLLFVSLVGSAVQAFV